MAKRMEDVVSRHRLDGSTRVVKSLDAFRCRMWSLHDRIDAYLDEVSCKQEIESIATHGQLVPALARPLKGDDEHDYELIFGARRLFVARFLNRPILAEVRDLTDRDAIIAMDSENRHRKDISPYERGKSYASWLSADYFSSQEEIARALRVSPSQVSRLLKLARLPSVIVDAFASAPEIYEKWGVDLMEVLDDPTRRQATLQRARTLSARNPRLPAAEVYRQLVTASGSKRRRAYADRDKVVRCSAGVPLFRVRTQRMALAFIVPALKLSPVIQASIETALTVILREPPADGGHRDSIVKVVPKLERNDACTRAAFGADP